MNDPLKNYQRIKKSGICILGGGGLGDLLIINPLLKALEEADIKYFYATSALHAQHLLAEFIPENKLIVLPKNILKLSKQLLFLSKRVGHVYLGPHANLLTKIIASIIGKEILDYDNNLRSYFLGDLIKYDVKRLGMSVPNQIITPNTQVKKSFSSPYILIHKGSKNTWKTKSWPDCSWQVLLQDCLDLFTYNLVIIGSSSEINGINDFLNKMNHYYRSRIIVFESKTLNDIFSVVKTAQGVICHNSGVMHAAILLGKPTVAINGSTPLYWQSNDENIINLTSGLCDKMCNKYKCPAWGYKAKCINQLKVKTVLDAVKKQFIDIYGK